MTVASGLVQETVNTDSSRANDVYRNYIEVEIYNWKLGSDQACKDLHNAMPDLGLATLTLLAK